MKINSTTVSFSFLCPLPKGRKTDFQQLIWNRKVIWKSRQDLWKVSSKKFRHDFFAVLFLIFTDCFQGLWKGFNQVARAFWEVQSTSFLGHLLMAVLAGKASMHNYLSRLELLMRYSICLLKLIITIVEMFTVLLV